MSIPQSILPFKIELLEEAENVTAHAALPLLIETERALHLPGAWRALADALGYEDAAVAQRHTESLVVLMAAGGDHASDLDVLGGDRGLEKLLGFSLSSPTQAKDFLYRFHQSEEGQPLLPGDDEMLSVAGKAQIRPEGPGLRALATLSYYPSKSSRHTKILRGSSAPGAPAAESGGEREALADVGEAYPAAGQAHKKQA